MGLASADELSLTIRPDEILTYSIPQKWSLEEAASVPVSYSLVSFFFFLVRHFQRKT